MKEYVLMDRKNTSWGAS